MTNYGKLFKHHSKKMITQDLDEVIDEHIHCEMRDLYLKLNPPPPKDNTMKTLDLFGDLRNSYFEIRGTREGLSTHEGLRSVTVATSIDIAVIKIDESIHRVKTWLLGEIIFIVLTITQWAQFWRFFWPLCAILFFIINFDEIRFVINCYLRKIEVYKKIADEERKKLVEGVIEK